MAAALLALVAFLSGSFDYVLEYWKELGLVLVLIFAVATLVVWFRKLLQIEKRLEVLSESKKTQPFIDYGPEIKALKQELIKKIEVNTSSLSRIDSDLIEMKRDHLYTKAEKYHANGQRGALLCRLEIIEIDIKNNSYELDDSLEELYSYVKSKNAFSTQDLSDAKEALSKVEGTGKKEIANHILDHIKSKLH